MNLPQARDIEVVMINGGPGPPQHVRVSTLTINSSTRKVQVFRSPSILALQVRVWIHICNTPECFWSRGLRSRRRETDFYTFGHSGGA